jgi:hypothetical protein
MAMVFGLFLMLFGLGALCALAYNWAVYAVPVFAGLRAGFGALHLGAGALGAVAAGFFMGSVAFGLCQMTLVLAPSNLVRLLVVACFVLPAAAVGYSAGLQLSALAISSVIWQYIYAVIGAISVGCSALVRLTTPTDQPRLGGKHSRA